MVIFLKSLGVFIRIIEVIIILRIFFSITGLKGLFSEKIYEITEPALSFIRLTISRIGLNTGFFDFSALILLFILKIVQNLLERSY